MTTEAKGQPTETGRPKEPVSDASPGRAGSGFGAQRLLWVALFVVPNFALVFWVADTAGIWPVGCGTAALVVVTLGVCGVLFTRLRRALQLLGAERQEAQEARRVTEKVSAEQYRLLFETNPQPAWIYDMETLRFLTVNGAALRLYGYSREEFLGMTLKDICPPNEVPRLMERLANLSATVWLGSNWRHRKKDGTVFDVETTAHPQVFHGRPARLTLISDITERKRTEEALREGQDLFYSFMDNSPTVAFMKDAEGRMIYINATYEKTFQTTLAAVRGKSDAELWPPEVARSLREHDLAVLAGDKVVELVETVPTPDGQRHEWLAFKFPLHNVGGRRYLGGMAIDITDRRQTIEALRESERQFTRLFESSPDAIFVEDSQGKVLDVNPAACRLHGLARQQLIGRNVLDLVPADKRDEVGAEFPKLASGEHDHADGYSLGADGRSVPVSIRASRMNYRGQPAVLLHVRDISSRLLAEEVVRSSERRFRALIEQSRDGVALLNRKGIIRYASPSTTRIMGYTQEELLDHCAFDLVRAEDLEAVKTRFAQMLEKPGAGTPIQFCYRHKDGSWRWMEGVGTNLLDDPPVAAIVLNFADITERKEAESQLRAVMASARCLLWHAIVRLSPGDAPGKMDWSTLLVQNEDAARQFFPVETQAGQTYSDAWVRSKLPEDLEQTDQTSCGAFMSGKPGYTQEYRCKLAKGDVRWFYEDVSIQPIAPGRWSAIGVCTDITERKALEEQLRQAHKMEAIGQLAGGVAHDFNNLLMVIRGYCELMLEGMASDDAFRPQAQHIQKAADRAAALVQQLLAFSRKQVFQPKVLELNHIIGEMEPMLRRLIGEDIELIIHRKANLGHIKADRTQIEQVIMNLAANARDAMPSGGKLIIETANAQLDAAYARRHPDLKPGRYVQLAVSDTGKGMDAQTRAHIFEPFFTTKENTKRAGLGLATVYGIVKQSGGHIWVYSEPEHGAVFKVYLPRVDEPAEPERAASRPDPKTLQGNETVLLVEDDDEVRTLACEFLERRGYRVIVASNGEEATQIAGRHKKPIHLLLTDVVMPGMSGRIVAQLVVSIHPETKVLYISGYTDITITHHGIIAAGTAFLQKPFTPDALALKVREVLEGK
ncbi:MAG: PAS domain S-box protein [Verrucomicrobia bacterium]|nr:PAS domain S-box protein [Verrucomicrobiota bacterium]